MTSEATGLATGKSAVSEAWLGSSEMAAGVRAFDWGSTHLGQISGWSRSLKSAVAICLRSPLPMAIYWGPELTCIYNDAERDVLGNLHPRALGLPARELLRDSWPAVGEQLRSVIARGDSTSPEDQLFSFERFGRGGRSYVTYSCSPIPEDDGSVGGVLLVAQDTAPPGVLSEPDGAGSGRAQDGSEARPSVVAVEGNDEMRGYLRRLLSPEFAVQFARDGTQALELALADPPSLVISDVMMPSRDGFDLVQTLRASAQTSQVPVILLSARADPESTLHALELGADDYIIKPCGAPELLARVRVTLTNARERSDWAVAHGREQERARHGHELWTLLRDLRAAQRRVASAGDAERRRIERDLHDGAQQRLMALRLELGLLEECLGDEPRRAAKLLGGIRRELDEALEELRDLAHGLYPPLLASDGLEAALTATARRSPIPVTIQATGIIRAPRSIESAAYFCCLEALQNVAKHAGPGAEAAIELEMTDRRLRFWVRDDGRGFDSDAVQPGHGLINLHDRVDALGGVASVTSAPGAGTTVSGEMPLP